MFHMPFIHPCWMDVLRIHIFSQPTHCFFPPYNLITLLVALIEKWGRDDDGGTPFGLRSLASYLVEAQKHGDLRCVCYSYLYINKSLTQAPLKNRLTLRQVLEGMMCMFQDRVTHFRAKLHDWEGKGWEEDLASDTHCRACASPPGKYKKELVAHGCMSARGAGRACRCEGRCAAPRYGRVSCVCPGSRGLNKNTHPCISPLPPLHRLEHFGANPRLGGYTKTKYFYGKIDVNPLSWAMILN